MADIIFVDRDDNVIGSGTRSAAIEQGIIHRIARVYVVNSEGLILIQKRSATQKIPNRWDQSAAGHVEGSESYAEAAKRELEEEVGITDCELHDLGTYYSEETDDGRTKKRYNGLFATTSDATPVLNDGEVSETKWIEPDALKQWMAEKPEDFTQGFIHSFEQYLASDHTETQ